MSSPPRGSRTPRRTVPSTPSRRTNPSTPRRSARQTPSRGAQTPRRDDDGSRTPTRPTNQDGMDATPMRWGAPRPNEAEEVGPSSEVPVTSPAPGIIPTSPAPGRE